MSVGAVSLRNLQLLFPPGTVPGDAELAGLTAFAARAAQALRALERADELRRELERTRDLLSVVDEATARPSLAHTLETAFSYLPRLLDVSSVGIYLRHHGRFETAAAAEVTGPHSSV